jgi:predicted MFS family arabinose efflux permease
VVIDPYQQQLIKVTATIQIGSNKEQQIVPNEYFSTKLGLAQGLIKAGGGLGGAALSLGLDAMIQKLGVSWAFRILGAITLAAGLPAAWIVKDRYPIKSASFIEWRLFRDFSFLMVFFAGAVATFALFVPAFFLPLYAYSLGLPSSTGAALLADFNFSTAIDRLVSGFSCDFIGPLNTISIAMLVNAMTMLSIWPVSDTLAPLVAFAIINGIANGSFFTSMLTAVGTLYGSARVPVTMGMIITGWTGGYFAGAPIAGYILQAYGGKNPDQWAYRPAIFYAGSMAVGAAGFVLMLRLRLSLRLFKKL